METRRRKRKGTRASESSGFCLSGEADGSRQIKKKCREPGKGSRAGKVESWGCNGDRKAVSCAGGVAMTAPPSGRPASDFSGRGLKRKIGCVESVTRVGRKKKLENEYVLGREIGKGKFGSVRLCRRKDSGEEFACKTLLKKGDEAVHREVEMMQHVSGHPGVVTLKAVFEDSESFHIVMELCPGGRLSDQMKKKGRYSEQQAASLMKELILVIKYCHEIGVVHRDIKPENILLSSTGKMKLADFGLAVRISTGHKLFGLAGTAQYLAPEVLLGDYSEKVDIWAAGVLLHQLLVGVHPFPRGPQEVVFDAIKTVKLDFEGELWESTSNLGRDLLGRMLEWDVSKRMGAEDVLRHPWILLHTECPSKAMCSESGVRNNLTSRVELGRIVTTSWSTSIESPSSVMEQQDGCAFVNSLAAAISRLTITEWTHSRLCSPVRSIRQQCSSNLKTNLCPAF